MDHLEKQNISQTSNPKSNGKSLIRSWPFICDSIHSLSFMEMYQCIPMWIGLSDKTNSSKRSVGPVVEI